MAWPADRVGLEAQARSCDCVGAAGVRALRVRRLSGGGCAATIRWVSQDQKPTGSLRFGDPAQRREADRSTSAFVAAAEASAAEWVVGGVRNFDFTVGSIIPDDFAAYVRVFHPAARGPWPQRVEVRWAEVAASNGRVMHPAAE